MSCRITFIGASLRTLGVIRDWVVQSESAAGSHVCVMDLDEQRARVVSSLAREMPQTEEHGVTISGTTDLGEALEGADFVYNVIRVGGHAQSRDTRIGVNYGFHGHDDFGPGAAMIVLRTAPVVVNLAREMEKRCPDAWLLNFTNPVPFIVRAVVDFTKIRTLGLCGGDRNQLHDIPTTLGWKEVPCMDFRYRGVGIDHFSWSTELTYKGEDFYPRLFEESKTVDRSKLPWYCRFSLEVLDLYGQWISASGHCHHWTHHEEMAAQLRDKYRKIDKAAPSPRADHQNNAFDGPEQWVGKKMGSALWEQPEFKGVLSPPGFPALGINVMASMLADRGDEMMVSMRAPGAVDNLQDEGIVLLSAKLFRDGPQPLHFEGVPEGIAPLTRQILDYQKALVDAAVRGTRRDLEEAIFMDPMMRDMGTGKTMLDELLEANRNEIRPELLKW